MEKWLRERLSICLDFEIPDDMVKYILSMKSSNEFDEYFQSLLNPECEDHLSFLHDCKQRLFSKALPNKKSGQQAQPKQMQQDSGSKVIKQHDGSAAIKQQQQQQHQHQQATLQQQQAQGAKKKTKFVKLYANDGKLIGDTIMLKGRRRCDCQASQHKLVNNCMCCGRIVCEQEGSGPCLFCSEIVCTNEEQHLMKTDTKQGERLLKSLKQKGGGGEALQKALAQRDRLLEYDRNSEKRTTVIDDELDYFQENSVWLSDAEREKCERLKMELHEKKHAGRAQRKIKVDFAGRALDDDDDLPVSVEYERSVLKELANATAAERANNASRQQPVLITLDTCTDPNMDAPRPVYQASILGNAKLLPEITASNELERVYNRVQDSQLMEMQDMRQCLSLHQPYASLLAAGIKKHEGRTWYTQHRGRLWIASTAKQPRPEEIRDLENFYRIHYNDPHMKFPKVYPTSSLIGCVRLEACLMHEEYSVVYPEGESIDSPYVFVCTNAEMLDELLPIKGQPKIYEIDPKTHNMACRDLLRSNSSNKG